MPAKIRIVVHGGAWEIPERLHAASEAGVRDAAAAGAAVLRAGGSALDAVEAAVRVMERDPVFDAGRGSCLTAAGAVEMDAMIMDGATLGLGAVAGVGSVASAVGLARLVRDRTPHVMLAGAGADAFAREQGVPAVEADALVTDEARRLHAQFVEYGGAVESLFGGHDTVGAVAVDARGRCACATSTGGIPAKRPGRVGDSPLVGSGGYADETGAASTTGHGEAIARVLLARGVLCGASGGGELQAAAEEALRDMRRRTGGCGGVIAVSPAGSVGLAHTTRDMPWAVWSSSQLRSGMRVPCGVAGAGVGPQSKL